MTTEEKKERIKVLTEGMLTYSIDEMKKKIERALNSGAIDCEAWDEKSSPMIIPKSIFAAVLESEAYQYKGTGTCFEKEVKANVKNLRYFI